MNGLVNFTTRGTITLPLNGLVNLRPPGVILPLNGLVKIAVQDSKTIYLPLYAILFKMGGEFYLSTAGTSCWLAPESKITLGIFYGDAGTTIKSPFQSSPTQVLKRALNCKNEYLFQVGAHFRPMTMLVKILDLVEMGCFRTHSRRTSKTIPIWTSLK